MSRRLGELESSKALQMTGEFKFEPLGDVWVQTVDLWRRWGVRPIELGEAWGARLRRSPVPLACATRLSPSPETAQLGRSAEAALLGRSPGALAWGVRPSRSPEPLA